jgi:hypothetical protein
MSVGDRGSSIRRAALLFPLFLALTASSLHAATAGIDLSWDDCGALGTSQKTFACNGGAARLVLVASAIAGVTLPKLCAEYSILEVQSAGTLSSWWQLSAGGCRGGSPSPIHADFDFTSGGGCSDPWSGGAFGGMDYAAGYGGAGKARIQTACAIPGSTSISGSDEYAVFRISISTARSDACGGCSEGVCLVLDSIELDQPKGVGDFVLTTPIVRNFVQWQGGVPAHSGGACSGAMVQTAKTWGGLKSLYH